MKRSIRFAVVLVTAPDLKTARALAKAALKEKLAACANIIPKLESHYWWQGKLESNVESLVIFKTSSSSLARLEKTILAHHPYDTPEFIAIPVSRGNQRYLKWITESIRGR
jgi:periplasmic divalent cation tolerance protein